MILQLNRRLFGRFNYQIVLYVVLCQYSVIVLDLFLDLGTRLMMIKLVQPVSDCNIAINNIIAIRQTARQLKCGE